MKLGGSVLTDKSRYRTPRPEALARLAREIATAAGPVVVVHGAGSYGHVIAREHRLVDGDDGSAARRLAFARVLADVRELSGLVTGALRDAGLAAVPLSTFDLARLDRGALLRFAHGQVGDALASGFTPVLGGDGALDAARGFGILSGDVLMAEIARAYRPERAIFVTDVDGIFDRAPRDPGARLLARIGPGDAPPADAGASGADVTGGMGGKLRRAREVARTGVPVHVVSGLAPGRLAEALSGGSPIGTVVTA